MVEYASKRLVSKRLCIFTTDKNGDYISSSRDVDPHGRFRAGKLVKILTDFSKSLPGNVLVAFSNSAISLVLQAVGKNVV